MDTLYLTPPFLYSDIIVTATLSKSLSDYIPSQQREPTTSKQCNGNAGKYFRLITPIHQTIRLTTGVINIFYIKSFLAQTSYTAFFVTNFDWSAASDR